MSEVIGIVYMTTNLVNGRRYIGQHLVESGYNDEFDGYLGSGTLLRKAISHYGESNFERMTLKECYSREELDQAEEYYLNLYDCANNPLYYNMINTTHLGGRHSGYHHSKETKQKIGINSGASRKGKKLSDSHRSSISESLSRKENRERQSKLIKGRVWINNGDSEKTINSDELNSYISQGYKKGRLPQTIEKVSKSNTGKPRPQTENQKEALLKAIIGSVAINKDGKTIKVSSEDVDSYLKDGWTRGMSEEFREQRSKDVSGKIHVYKGETQKFIYRDELDTYLRDGWLRGLPPSQREKLRKAAIIREAKKRESKDKKKINLIKEV